MGRTAILNSYKKAMSLSNYGIWNINNTQSLRQKNNTQS
jgi:hypothetical protein